MENILLDKNIEESSGIDYKYLSELDIDDSFFDSLREDYAGFDEWFRYKQLENAQAYVQERDGRIISFLLFKVEDESEDYEDFLEPFIPARRLKISTLKDIDPERRMGELFIIITEKTVEKENVLEIYITAFDKQEYLIHMLESYGFEKYTKKKTLKPDGSEELENVLVKRMKES